jgi:hypothetical protein
MRESIALLAITIPSHPDPVFAVVKLEPAKFALAKGGRCNVKRLRLFYCRGECPDGSKVVVHSVLDGLPFWLCRINSV